GLDWLNFFLADIQTGFGAFVAFYLADLGWNKDQVGLALSVGTIAGLIALLPGGAIVDWVPWKRGLAAIGIVTIAASALVLAFAPTFVLVFIAQILQGITSGIVTPAIAAMSLGLVGRSAMSARTGRNSAFDAAGNALTAGVMGALGQYISKSAIFLGAAALCIPALIALSFIRGDEINYARARNAGIGQSASNFQRRSGRIFVQRQILADYRKHRGIGKLKQENTAGKDGRQDNLKTCSVAQREAKLGNMTGRCGVIRRREQKHRRVLK